MIKQKTHKKCKCCGNTFKMHKTTDKYCSTKCYFEGEENIKNNRIKKQSDKRKMQNDLYLIIRKKFLAKKEICPVALRVFNKKIEATEIHHKKGRVGSLLNDTSFWLAVSREGHTWIDNNPDEARKLGFLINSSHK